MRRLALVAALLLTVNSFGEEKLKDHRHLLVPRLDHVVDGDFAVVITGGDKISVRMEGVDAPELMQAFGVQAKEALSRALPKGVDIVLEDYGKDKYGCMLAIVHNRKFSPDSISLFLINHGCAWHFSKYNDSTELANAQKLARSKHCGLWSESVKPMAPWDYRMRQDRGEVMDKKVQKPSPLFY